MRLLLDTSVVIDVLRDRQGRRERLAELIRAGHTLVTSAINVAEIYAGMRPEEQERTELFLSALECHSITELAARRAGSMKREWATKGRTLSLADTIIAAVAIEQGCTLMTDNSKDFPMEELPHYSLENY